jgi:hypothetical protein
MPVPRTRSAGAKVNDEEYQQLEALAQARGLTLGEWCRQILLAQLNPAVPKSPEETILAEVLGLRMILLNGLYALASGEKLTAEQMQALIKRADAEKLTAAAQRLADQAAGKEPKGS